MYDHLIREAFHSQILKPAHADGNTLVVDELGIHNGCYRADIAVLNGKLEGFEIKGEHDTLTRLNNQIEAYNSIFDKASIITCKRYLEECKALVPAWWGIYLAKTNTDEISFKRIRAARLNKTIDGFSLARLLWRDEALEVAALYLDKKDLAKARRHEIYYAISEKINTKELSKLVLEKLKQRRRWRTNLEQL